MASLKSCIKCVCAQVFIQIKLNALDLPFPNILALFLVCRDPCALE